MTTPQDPTVDQKKLGAFDSNPFLDGPSQFLVKTVASEIAKVPEFALLFQSFIDPYKRMDYQIRNLPALRIYNDDYVKEFESWFINGDLKLDVIWPASIRRKELQQLQDTVAAAILQQFRRPSFFDSVESPKLTDADKGRSFKLLGVPGLNELGKRFQVDKRLGFEMAEDQWVPLTQITVNFRIDLREWDRYLEDQLRTKDDPFEQTLGELRRLVYDLHAVQENGEDGVDIPMDHQAGVPPSDP